MSGHVGDHQNCQQRLRRLGMAYPRTCQACGLFGACRYPYPDADFKLKPLPPVSPSHSTPVGAGDGQTFIPRPVYHHELAGILVSAKPHGCVCPVGAEATCKGFACPRAAYRLTSEP